MFSLVDIVKKGNIHPLARQYVSVTICKFYNQVCYEERDEFREYLL